MKTGPKSNAAALPISMMFVCISMMFVSLGSVGNFGAVRPVFWVAGLVFALIGLIGALRNLRRVQQEAAEIRARSDDQSVPPVGE